MCSKSVIKIPYSQKRNSSFWKGRPLIRDNGGLQSWNHSFFSGLIQGHHIWRPQIRKENKRQEDTMSHIETRNPIGSLESAGCDLPFWVLEIFEALRKVSQIEIQSTVSPETNVIMSSSTILCSTSCISRSLPPKKTSWNGHVQFVMSEWYWIKF